MLIKNKILFEDSKIFSKTVFDQIIVSGSNFLTTFILIRYLGLQDFGLFSKIWIVIISINIIQQAIIINPLLSISSKLINSHKEKYLSETYNLQLVFSFCFFIILFFVAKLTGNFIFEEKNNLKLFIMLSSTIFIQLNEFYRRAFYVNDKILELIKFDSIRYFIQICFLFFILSKGIKGSEVILIIFSLSSLFSILFHQKYIPKLSFSFKATKNAFKKNWVISKWLITNSLVSWFQSNYLLFLTSFTLGPISLAVIRSFQTILGISHIILNSLDTWLPVKIAKVFKKESSHYFENYIRRFIFNSSIIFSILFVILTIFSKEIISILDQSLTDYVLPFRLFCITYLLISINNPIRNILLGIEKTVSNFYGSIISVFFILFLGRPLINIFSLNGIILSYLFSQLIIFLINNIHLRKKLDILKKNKS